MCIKLMFGLSGVLVITVIAWNRKNNVSSLFSAFTSLNI